MKSSVRVFVKLQFLIAVIVNCTALISSKSLQGTFEGRIPCADCPAIMVYLNLQGNSEYNLLWKYIERNVELKDSGTWNIVEPDENKIITLKSKVSHSETFFLIDNSNTIEMLDNNKNRINNGLNYTLHKKNSSRRTIRR